jgi:hypothetical protein
MEVFPAPRKPVKTVIGTVEGVSELEGMVQSSAGRVTEIGSDDRGLFVDRQYISASHI